MAVKTISYIKEYPLQITTNETVVKINKEEVNLVDKIIRDYSWKFDPDDSKFVGFDGDQWYRFVATNIISDYIKGEITVSRVKNEKLNYLSEVEFIKTGNIQEIKKDSDLEIFLKSNGYKEKL